MLLNAEGGIGIVLALATADYGIHLLEGISGKGRHGIQLRVLLTGEVLSRPLPAVQDACQVEAGITDALHLADKSHHLSHLQLRLVGEMVIAYFLQERGYLEFRTVGQGLLMFYLPEEFFECFIVVLVEEVADHLEHPAEALSELDGFFLCLHDRYFRGLDEVGLDILQAELLQLGLRLLGKYPAHQTLQLGYEPDEDAGVDDVEAGVEHGEHYGEPRRLSCHRRVVANDAAYHVDKGIEHAEHPYHANDIEHQMSQGCAACLGVGTEGGKVGCCRGTDIFAHDEGYSQIDGEHAGGTEQDGDCHHGGR